MRITKRHPARQSEIYRRLPACSLIVTFRFYARLTCAFLVLALSTPSVRAQLRFTDITQYSGVDFVHTDGSTGRYYMLESMTGGVALLDFDQDGDDDIYLLNGRNLDRVVDADTPTNHLFRNDGDWRFVDVTEMAGLADNGFGLGVAAADYDNDGATDLYVNNLGANVLYHNNGDGTFSNRTQWAGTSNGNRAGGGVVLFDMDSDGDLDLYVANYIRFDLAQQTVHMHKGFPAYPSPLKFDPDPDSLFENLGDGRFRDISTTSGIDAFAGRSMGVVALDHDQDGDLDIAVANDSQANFLFENLGDHQFDEVGLLTGIAYDFRGNSQASMGIEVADLDRNGLFDLYVTSLNNEYSTYYRNAGEGFFEDATRLTNAGADTYAHVTWGVVAADFNLDGMQDLYVAAGHLDDRVDVRGGTSNTTGFSVPNIALVNLGSNFSASRNSPTAISENSPAFSSRGLAAADLDRDGDTDLVALNSRNRPSLLRNDSPRDRRGFIKIRLVGTRSNRQAIGAVVRVTQGKQQQFELVSSGSSYQSDSSKELVFGVRVDGDAIKVATKWPGQNEFDQHRVVELNETLSIVEP